MIMAKDTGGRVPTFFPAAHNFALGKIVGPARPSSSHLGSIFLNISLISKHGGLEYYIILFNKMSLVRHNNHETIKTGKLQVEWEGQNVTFCNKVANLRSPLLYLIVNITQLYHSKHPHG